MPRSRSKSPPSRRVYSGSDADSDFDTRSTAKRQKRNRNYRRKGSKSSELTLGADTIATLDKEVEARVAAAIKEDGVARRIQERLLAERARLEAELEAKLAEERRAQLLRKRREQEQRMKEQAELERILIENQKKLEQAKTQAEKREEEPVAKTEKMHSLLSKPADFKGAQLGEDVVILGRARVN